jgi:hypothetical protein
VLTFIYHAITTLSLSLLICFFIAAYSSLLSGMPEKESWNECCHSYVLLQEGVWYFTIGVVPQAKWRCWLTKVVSRPVLLIIIHSTVVLTPCRLWRESLANYWGRTVLALFPGTLFPFQSCRRKREPGAHCTNVLVICYFSIIFIQLASLLV